MNEKTNLLLCNWILVVGGEISSDCMDSEKCYYSSEILKRNVADVFYNIRSNSRVFFKGALLMKKTLMSKIQRV